MKIKLTIILIYFIQLNTYSQCEFAILSNDTIFQDRIQNVFDDNINEQIVVFGSRHVRKELNNPDSIFNAPIFYKFDYCGNLLSSKIFQYIDSFKIDHRNFQYNPVYFYESTAHRVFQFNPHSFHLVLPLIDTLNKIGFYSIVEIDYEGNILNFSKLMVSQNEYQLYAQTLVKFSETNYCLFLQDYQQQINAIYFLDGAFNARYKLQNVSLDPIRSIIATEDNKFIICTYSESNATANISKYDTAFNLEWNLLPYGNRFGTIRQFLKKGENYIAIGSIKSNFNFPNQDLPYGIILEFSAQGNLINELKINSKKGSLEFSSLIIDANRNYNISGYLNSTSDSSGSDVIIYQLDTFGKILWDTSYNFKNNFGTSSTRGYFHDYGGDKIIKLKDNSLLTFGYTEYSPPNWATNRKLHEDATLIKTRTNSIHTQTVQSEKHSISLFPNPFSDYIQLIGQMDQVTNYKIFSIEGMELLFGDNNFTSINTTSLPCGSYILQIFFKNKTMLCKKLIKF
ncbi:MAG: T9SS type A sorting domain-containing protein [Saprospiraceae bacterium]|nr:T9SS type A sorting domain-containing protein [Saprospiraceae bacterium]HRG69638.1 T9SS type A sorting domain-containing protein [Saprospiraceae bacterium]